MGASRGNYGTVGCVPQAVLDVNVTNESRQAGSALASTWMSGVRDVSSATSTAGFNRCKIGTSKSRYWLKGSPLFDRKTS
jgi:hypothetical protein